MTATAPAVRQARSASEPIIATSALSKDFKGGLRAVDGVDLEVARGEFFGLLGPNGAGKTTTIGMLTTRVLPTSGRAHVAGCDVVAEPARTKQSIGVVSQTNTLDRSLSARENLYYHARYFGYGRRRAGALADFQLDQFRLGDKRDVLVDKLSGGLAQRLMIARALMHEPEVLFLDEPTVGLDPQSRIALWELLSKLNAAGQSILLTTHYMEEADRLCHRVAIMDHGRVLACDHPEELKHRVDAQAVVRVTPTARELGGQPHPDDVAVLADTLADVASVTRVEIRDGAVECFAATARGLLPRLVAAAERAGLTVSDLSATEPSLETVFVSLTGRELRE